MEEVYRNQTLSRAKENKRRELAGDLDNKEHRQKYTHFPGESGLTSCPVDSPSPFNLKLRILAGSRDRLNCSCHS